MMIMMMVMIMMMMIMMRHLCDPCDVCQPGSRDFLHQTISNASPGFCATVCAIPEDVLFTEPECIIIRYVRVRMCPDLEGIASTELCHAVNAVAAPSCAMRSTQWLENTVYVLWTSALVP